MTQVKNIGKIGVCFFLMSGMVHAQKEGHPERKKLMKLLLLAIKSNEKKL